MISIELDLNKCTGCGLCVDLCPLSVFDLSTVDKTPTPKATRPEDCCACMTCSGKCPESAILVHQPVLQERFADDNNPRPFSPINRDDLARYKEYADGLEDILKLRWKPVAVTLIRKGDSLPHIPVPRVRLRYCQALLMARRGKHILMPASSHSCPDGSSILGLTKLPDRLATGDIYYRLGKLATKEAARKLLTERPRLEELSMQATLSVPLESAVMAPDVVVIIAPPETMMWLCMSFTFFSGERMNFRMGSYNAQCLESTLYPYKTGDISLSLGCYGCRSVSDLSDDLMFMGVPEQKLHQLITGLKHLSKKAIPDARSKIYLPPLI